MNSGPSSWVIWRYIREGGTVVEGGAVVEQGMGVLRCSND